MARTRKASAAEVPAAQPEVVVPAKVLPGKVHLYTGTYHNGSEPIRQEARDIAVCGAMRSSRHMQTMLVWQSTNACPVCVAEAKKLQGKGQSTFEAFLDPDATP